MLTSNIFIKCFLGLGLRSSLTWHVKIHDFESIPKTKNKEPSMFWDIIEVGICNISTNEAFYAEKSSILRISYTKSEIVSFILNWHIVLVLLTLIMDTFTSNIFIPPSFLPLYISFPPSDGTDGTFFGFIVMLGCNKTVILGWVVTKIIPLKNVC